ncbi:MAG: alpha/beta hydrolase [Aeromicrobium sp.]
MEVVRSHGIEVAFERVGSGPPLVLAHGAAEDGRIWRPQVDRLADEFTVVAWDEPGTGQSSDVPSTFTMEDYADCLAAVIESVAPGPAHVGGLSWGGTVVLELYRRRPDLVATLVLVGTFAGWKGSLSDDDLRARVEGAREMLADPSTFDARLPGLFAGDTPAEFEAMLDEMADEYRPAAFAQESLVMADTDQRDVLPNINVPTLLVWGELDVRSPLRVAREFEQAIPDTTLVVIPGSGHVCNLERPDEFNDAVREFCRAHPPASLLDDE